MQWRTSQELQAAMRLAGLTARKSLGQHFLIDEESLETMVAAGAVGPSDTVLEIGPGLGMLTTALTQTGAQVVAVEADARLAALLERERPANLQVIRGDIRHFDLTRLPAGYKVVANIPYYLTSVLFQLFLEAPRRPQRLAWLIQKEVAERVVARPGQLSLLAVSVQYYGEPRLVEVVERQKFWPAPKVDSAILQVRVYDQPAFAADPVQLFRLVRAGFSERRKQLKNSLAGGLTISVERAVELIAIAKLGSTARAQELSLPDWERLYRAAQQLGVLANQA